MANKNLEKWNLLLSQVEVIRDELSPSLLTLTEAELLQFESRSGLTLPQEYKEYCQVFGDGRFGGNMFFIEIPEPENVEAQLTSNANILNAGESYNKWPIGITELLESAYLFGGGQSKFSFIFDLKSYDDKDKSCDIYGLSSESYLEFISRIGRSFFVFVRDFCIGKNGTSICPGFVIPENFDEGGPLSKWKTFIPSPGFEEDTD